MERRPFDYDRDIDLLTQMQAQSFDINFPGERFIERFFRDELLRLGRNDIVYVYEESGAVVGWLWLDTGRTPRAVHIRHIQVVEQQWGHGVAKRMLADAVSLCAALSRSELTLNVTKSNGRAMALYAHLGFRAVEDNGARQYMALRLTPDASAKVRT